MPLRHERIAYHAVCMLQKGTLFLLKEEKCLGLTVIQDFILIHHSLNLEGELLYFSGLVKISNFKLCSSLGDVTLSSVQSDIFSNSLVLLCASVALALVPQASM